MAPPRPSLAQGASSSSCQRRFRCPQRGQYMGEALKRALTLGPTWDLVLHSDAGERFRCHQAVLGAVSPVLKSILEGWEFMVLSHPVIILPDISSRALDAFLKFIYTGSVVIRRGSSTFHQFRQLAKMLKVNPQTEMEDRADPRPPLVEVVDPEDEILLDDDEDDNEEEEDEDGDGDDELEEEEEDIPRLSTLAYTLPDKGRAEANKPTGEPEVITIIEPEPPAQAKTMEPSASKPAHRVPMEPTLVKPPTSQPTSLLEAPLVQTTEGPPLKTLSSQLPVTQLPPSHPRHAREPTEPLNDTLVNAPIPPTNPPITRENQPCSNSPPTTVFPTGPQLTEGPPKQPPRCEPSSVNLVSTEPTASAKTLIVKPSSKLDEPTLSKDDPPIQPSRHESPPIEPSSSEKQLSPVSKSILSNPTVTKAKPTATKVSLPKIGVTKTSSPEQPTNKNPSTKISPTEPLANKASSPKHSPPTKIQSSSPSSTALTTTIQTPPIEAPPAKTSSSSQPLLESPPASVPSPPVPTSTANRINLKALEADLARLHGEAVPEPPEPIPTPFPESKPMESSAPTAEPSVDETSDGASPSPYDTTTFASPYESPDTLNSTVEDDSPPVDGFVMPSNFDLPPDYLSQARTNTETVYAPAPILPEGLSSEQPRLSYDFLCLSPLSNATPRHEPDYYIQANEIDSTNDHPGNNDAFQAGRSWSSPEESGSSPEPSESPNEQLFPESPYRTNFKNRKNDNNNIQSNSLQTETVLETPGELPVMENPKQDEPTLMVKKQSGPEVSKMVADTLKRDPKSSHKDPKQRVGTSLNVAKFSEISKESIKPMHHAKKDSVSKTVSSPETAKVAEISGQKSHHSSQVIKDSKTQNSSSADPLKVSESVKKKTLSEGSSIPKTVTSSSPDQSEIASKNRLNEHPITTPSTISIRTDLGPESGLSPKSSEVSNKKMASESSKLHPPSTHISKDLKTKAKNSSSVTTPKDIMDELFGTDEGPQKKKKSTSKSVIISTNTKPPVPTPSTPSSSSSSSTTAATSDQIAKEKHSASVREELEAKRQRMLQMLKKEETPRPSPDVRPLKKRTPVTYVSSHEPEKSWLVADSDFEEEQATLSSSSTSSKSSADDVEASTDCEQVRKSREERLQKRRRKLGVPAWFDRGGRKVQVKYFETGAENILELAHYRLRLLAGDEGDSDGSGDDDRRGGVDEGTGSWRSRHRRAQRTVDLKRSDFSKLKRTFSEFQERSKKGRTASSSSSRSSSRSSSSDDESMQRRRRPKLKSKSPPLHGSPSKTHKAKKIKRQSESDADKQRALLKRHHSQEPRAKSPLVPFKIRKSGSGQGHLHDDKKPGKSETSQGSSSSTPRQSVDALFGTVHSYGLSSEGSLTASATLPQKEAIMSMSFKKKKKDTKNSGEPPSSVPPETKNVVGPDGLPMGSSATAKLPAMATVVIEKLTPGLKIKNQRTILSDDSDSDTNNVDGTK